jgi:hypothetical protein
VRGPDLTPEVRALVEGPVATRMHLEALLTLRRAAPAPRPLPEVVDALGGCEASIVQRCLDDLAGAGLVDWTPDGAARFHPASTALHDAADALVRFEAEAPVALARAILRRPVRAARRRGPTGGRSLFPPARPDTDDWP